MEENKTLLHKQVKEFMIAMDQHREEKPTAKIPAKIVLLRARLIMEEAFEMMKSCFTGNLTCEVPYVVTDLEDCEKRVRGILSYYMSGQFLPAVDLPELADALGDLDYVVEGTRMAFGIDGDPIAKAIHEANMKKLDGPIDEYGKKTKPLNWTPPDIRQILLDQGWVENE